MLIIILLVILIVLMIGGLPHWPYANPAFGWYPSGVFGLLLIILVIWLVLGGRFP